MTSGSLITPIHTSIAGRARLEVSGLYHSAAMKRRLESALSAASGIRSAEANTCTGRLLVVYVADIPLSDIVDLIEQQLRGTSARQRPAGPRRRSGRWQFDAAPVLRGFAALLRTLPSTSHAGVIMAAMADSSAASTGAQKAQQAIRLWHLPGIDEVLQRLEVSTAGRDITEAQQRLMTWRSTFS